ncbi:MAG: hypothetical protein Q8Q59_10680 [Luteolibacter sp.]|jgi:hypothetical protein|nr:hypothetical protein [Luteolibacter sp.]
MRTRFVIFRFSTLLGLLTAAGASLSCMTTYDSAGRPVQSVDPAVAVAGAAAAGLVGYAIANDNDHHHHNYYGGGGYYRPYGRHYRRY